MTKKKGQTPKSPAHEKLNLLTQIIVVFGAIRDKLFSDPVNLQLLASVVFIAAIISLIGGAHG